MDRLDDVLKRLEQLPAHHQELGLEPVLGMVRAGRHVGGLDEDLCESLESAVWMYEESVAATGFLDPYPSCGLDKGENHILNAGNGVPIRISFVDGKPNRATHVLGGGASGTGKSTFLANICANAAQMGLHTLVLDTNRFYRTVRRMRDTHRFVRFTNLRVNLYQGIANVPARVSDQVVTSEIRGSYPLQYGEFEIAEVVHELWANGVPNLPAIVRALTIKRYPGLSRRSQYRDSALLILNNLLAVSSDVFRCAEGMSLETMLRHNLVLEVDELLPVHQGFFIRFLFEMLHLIAMAGGKRQPILFVLDEAQVLDTSRPGLGQKLLALRHYGVHLLANFQNFSLAPIEFVNSSDLLVSFRSVGSDVDAFAKAAGLTREQAHRVSRLERGTCVAAVMQSKWKLPVLATVPRLEFEDVSDEVVNEESQRFVEQFSWRPIEADFEASGRDDSLQDVGVDSFGKQLKQFMHDVLNQSHEFSALTQRFERAGIRSSSTGQAIVSKCVRDGLISAETLAIKQGRPITLCEPTEECLKANGVTWKKGRGSLRTRAATNLLDEKLRKLKGWHVQEEGTLEL